MPISASFAGAEEVDYGADGWEGIALGRGEADIECGFELIAEFDQVSIPRPKGVAKRALCGVRIPSEVVDKGGVEAHLRRREFEEPRNDGLHPVL